MMNEARHFNDIFTQTVSFYHHSDKIENRVNNPFISPYAEQTIDNLLYRKSWIDAVQWDLEDMIRDPEIDPDKALDLKRRIDKSNQDRTDIVEKIDDVFMEQFKDIIPAEDARLNTESIAWALDRLSILTLKVYHMRRQAQRKTADKTHRDTCKAKLQVLEAQQKDLIRAIDELIEDIAAGRRVIKVYRQMKMYNDPALNPVLYAQKAKR